MWTTFSLVLFLALQILVRCKSVTTKNGLASSTNESGLAENQILGMPVTLSAGEGGKKAANGSAPRDCKEYCSLSYPPHTYPQVSFERGPFFVV